MLRRAQQRGAAATRAGAGFTHGCQSRDKCIEQIQIGKKKVQVQREDLARSIGAALQVSTAQNKGPRIGSPVTAAEQDAVRCRIRRLEKASQRSTENVARQESGKREGPMRSKPK